MVGGDAHAQSLPDTPGYSLPLALQESLYFYDAHKFRPGPDRRGPAAFLAG